MPTGSAGDDVDFLRRAEFGLGDFHLVEENVPRVLRNAAQSRIADGARLLVDFLEHEVLEAALFRHDRIPGHVLHLARDGLSVEVRELHAVGGNDGHVAVGEEENVPRVMEDGGNVGGHEIFVVAEADYRRRSVARGNDLVRFVSGDHGQRKNAGELLHRLANRIFQRRPMTVGRLRILFDQVGNDFGVGLGGELVAFLDELFLQAKIVLDDAVVHDDDLAGAVAVRMGVFFRGTAVGGPAGVSNAVGAMQRLLPDGFFQIAQLAFGAANLEAVAVARLQRFLPNHSRDIRDAAGPR